MALRVVQQCRQGGGVELTVRVVRHDAHLDAAPGDAAVCSAVRDLKLHWLLVDPQRFGNDPPEARAFAGIDRAASGSGVRLVASSGSTRLYRITACWG